MSHRLHQGSMIFREHQRPSSVLVELCPGFESLPVWSFDVDGGDEPFLSVLREDCRDLWAGDVEEVDDGGAFIVRRWVAELVWCFALDEVALFHEQGRGDVADEVWLVAVVFGEERAGLDEDAVIFCLIDGVRVDGLFLVRGCVHVFTF